ncbi:MAG TPA: response regulator transcription factor [Caulobacteraceae bacterium]|jgi:DNA-binding NarL/FixJ family response regulator|nr:response regulator transcription factor [Caulobacteraceae bacterium]
MNILLVDDHAIVRDGLRRLLASLPVETIHEAATGREAVAIARAKPLDLIVLDLNLPELGGIELLGRLIQAGSAPVLVLSMHAEPLYVARAMDAGAQGYVSKNASPDELLTAVRRVAGGGRYVEAELAQALAQQGPGPAQSLDRLSARDLEILRLLAAGKSLSEIADALGLGYKTIANTLSQIKSKLGVARTSDLVRLTLEAGIG